MSGVEMKYTCFMNGKYHCILAPTIETITEEGLIEIDEISSISAVAEEVMIVDANSEPSTWKVVVVIFVVLVVVLIVVVGKSGVAVMLLAFSKEPLENVKLASGREIDVGEVLRIPSDDENNEYENVGDFSVH